MRKFFPSSVDSNSVALHYPYRTTSQTHPNVTYHRSGRLAMKKMFKNPPHHLHGRFLLVLGSSCASMMSSEPKVVIWMSHVESYLGVREFDTASFQFANSSSPEKAEKRCQYLPRIEEDIKMLDFRDQILVRSLSIDSAPLTPFILGISKRHRRSCNRRERRSHMSIFWIQASHSSSRSAELFPF